jgi:PAS domain S-box-containing protein
VFYLSHRVPISALLNFSSDYILAIDNDRKIIQVSDNLLQFVNTEREAIIGLDIRDFPSPLFTSQEMNSRLMDVLDGKEITFETKVQGSDSEYYFHIRMLPTTFEDGSQGVTWLLQDITERKQAEKKIRDLSKFPSENPNPVLRIRKDSVILYANGASKSWLEKWKSRIGEPVSEGWMRYVKSVLGSGVSERVEFDHESKVFSFVFTPVVDADYVNVYGRDITERKHIEKTLLETNWKLGERVKELLLLYTAIKAMQADISVEDLMPQLVDYLVPAMQFPNITAPVVEIKGKSFAHPRYREDLTHGIHADICVDDQVSGRVSVYYIEDRPFIIPQEQNMLNALAESLGIWLTSHKG